MQPFSHFLVKFKDLCAIFPFCIILTIVWHKILAGENFGEFGDLVQIRQNFICQLLVVSEKTRGCP